MCQLYIIVITDKSSFDTLSWRNYFFFKLNSRLTKTVLSILNIFQKRLSLQIKHYINTKPLTCFVNKITASQLVVGLLRVALPDCLRSG